MVRRLFALVIAALVVISLLCISYAHPGGTDGAGGHYDHSDGTYHYHHGYSAHSHRDMDGDGKKDCPYDFNDRTGWNSGSSSSSKTSNNSFLRGLIRVVIVLVLCFFGPFLAIYIFAAIGTVIGWVSSLFTKKKN